MQCALKNLQVSLFSKYTKLISRDIFLCAFSFVNAGILKVKKLELKLFHRKHSVSN